MAQIFRRVQSTPDPDTFEKVSRYTSHFYCDTFATKVCPLLGRNTINLYHNTAPIFVSRYFCRNIGVRGRWNTPSKSRPKSTEVRLILSKVDEISAKLSCISARIGLQSSKWRLFISRLSCDAPRPGTGVKLLPAQKVKQSLRESPRGVLADPPPPRICVKWVPFVKLAFSLGNRAHFGSKMGFIFGLFALRFQ